MKEFGILLFMFSALVLLTGLYMFKGHKIGILTGRAAYKNLSKEEWKNIGKYTMITSIFIFIIAIIMYLI